MSSSDGELTRASGDLDVNLLNFFQVSGNFAFEKRVETLTLAGGDTVETDLLTLGGSGLNAFLGLNGGSSDAFGVNLTNTDFALMLASERGGTRSWQALDAIAGTLEFIGLDGIEMAGNSISVVVNRAAADGSLVDFSENPLTITTGTATSRSLSMDSDDGESISAAASVNMDLFGFFQVDGSFGFEKKIEAVTLSDGSQIEVDLLTVGASQVDAFAGINGATADELGFDLSQLDFALALMTDRANRANKYTSLKAQAAGAAFTGIDGLTVSADTMEVLINQGITVPTQEEVTTQVNAVYQLIIDPTTAGTIAFTLGTETSTFSLKTTDSDAVLISAITQALEGFNEISSGDVLVSGGRLEGFTIEFIGNLIGTDVAGLGVNTIAAAISTTVSEDQAAQAGVSEHKQLVFERLRTNSPSVDVSVETVNPVRGGISERFSIIVTNPYSARGTFDIIGSGATGTVTFITGGDVTNNQSRIRSAVATALGTSESNVRVRFDQKYLNDHKYDVRLINALAGQDVENLSINDDDLRGGVVGIGNGTLVDGSGGSSEEQRVVITTAATGSFQLSLRYNGFTYQTDSLDLNAGAAAVETALNDAFSNFGGSVSVSGSAKDYLVVFEGVLTGVNVASLQVSVAADSADPSGTFQISLDGNFTSAIAYNSDPAILAVDIENALEALSGIGRLIINGA